MKSTNMNQLKSIFFRKSKPGISKVQMKSQRQHDWSKINVRNKIICMLVDKWVISGAVNSVTKELREAPLSSLLNAIIQPSSKMRNVLVARKMLLSRLLLFYSEVFFFLFKKRRESNFRCLFLSVNIQKKKH